MDELPRLCADSGGYGEGGCGFVLSAFRGRKSGVRSLRSEVGSQKSEVGGLKSEGGVNFVVEIKFHAEFLSNYYLFLEIQSIPHYDFHNSLLTGIANLIIAEVPAL